MRYLLDTNVCIHFLRKKGNALVKQRLVSHSRADLTLCTVVTAELRHGALVSNNPSISTPQVEAFVGTFAVFDFDESCSVRYADVRADLEARGVVIGDMDLMIAAVALVHGLIVVTHNRKDFSRITGLTIEDWEVP